MKLFIALAITLALTPRPGMAANKWFVVDSKNLRIYSDGSQEEVKQYAVKLERFRRVVAKLYKLNPTTEPVVIVAFRDPSAFAGFRPDLGPRGAVLGYNLGLGTEEIVALALYDRGPATQQLLYHECFHALVESLQNGWPLWLNEGAAEVFSTFEERGDKVVIGDAKWGHIRQLRHSGFLPLNQLLTAQVETFNGLRVFYPHSWALTHYLMFADHHAHLDQMAEFVHLLRNGTNDAIAFDRAFHMAPAALENDLSRYIRSEQFPAWEIPVADFGAEPVSDQQPVSEAQRDSVFGNLVLSRLDVNRAEYYFKKAMARDPTLATPYEGLGLCALFRERWTEARHDFEQGFVHDTQNYRAYLCYGLALYNEEARDHWCADAMPREKIVAIAEALKKCIELRPNHPGGYALLARLTLLPGENPDEGMKLIQLALQFQPGNQWFLLTKARLQIRLHDYTEARETLKPLLGKSVRDSDLKKEVAAAQRDLDALAPPSPKH
jgi:tetratricopeptide (TPR) repeat protein